VGDRRFALAAVLIVLWSSGCGGVRPPVGTAGGSPEIGAASYGAAGPVTPGRASLDPDALRWVEETLSSLTLRQQVA